MSRHSTFFSQENNVATSPSSTFGADLSLDNHLVIDPSRGVLAKDVEVLLEHLYHDAYEKAILYV